MTALLVIYYVGLAAVIGGLVYQALELRRLSKRIDGKTDKPKPKLRARRIATSFSKQTGQHFCFKCGTKVSSRGHTVKQCEETLAALDQEGAKLAPAPPPEEAHDPPMDRAPGAEDPGHDD